MHSKLVLGRDKGSSACPAVWTKIGLIYLYVREECCISAPWECSAEEEFIILYERCYHSSHLNRLVSKQQRKILQKEERRIENRELWAGNHQFSTIKTLHFAAYQCHGVICHQVILYPPNKSVLSLCWFMLMTCSVCPSWADRYWTVDVLPTPVSPTRSTGSFWTTHTATRSINTTDWRVKAKLLLKTNTEINLSCHIWLWKCVVYYRIFIASFFLRAQNTRNSELTHRPFCFDNFSVTLGRVTLSNLISEEVFSILGLCCFIYWLTLEKQQHKNSEHKQK